jgi:hypothetical protein
VNKPARDETSCPLTKENVKGHCPGVVAIVGMSLRLLSYDRGRLARDETPYSLWEKKEILLIYIYIYIYIYYYYYYYILKVFKFFRKRPLSWFGIQMMIMPLTRV